MARETTKRGWMVCSETSQPHGELYATEAEAREHLPKLYYHVRPVEVTIRVLGSPPQPWCYLAPLAATTEDLRAIRATFEAQTESSALCRDCGHAGHWHVLGGLCATSGCYCMTFVEPEARHEHIEPANHGEQQ